MMDLAVLNECEELSFSGKTPFPLIVSRLAANNVERYCADLVKLEKFYYAADGQSEVVTMPFQYAPAISPDWSLNKIRAAIRDIQVGDIQYPEFLKRIMSAGCVFYDVFIAGKKAVYVGRNGDMHIENFK